MLHFVYQITWNKMTTVSINSVTQQQHSHIKANINILVSVFQTKTAIRVLQRNIYHIDFIDFNNNIRQLF